MSKFVRNDAVIALTPNEDHTGKEGYAVTISSGKAALVTSDTALGFGIILDGEPTTGLSSIAVADGAGGTVRVKLSATPGTVAVGTYLTVTTGAVFNAAVSNKACYARALESGAANELIECVLVRPFLAP